MIVIPAIDLKEGKCVRLEQGLMDKDTVFNDDPAAQALEWQRQGAELLHIVDLDGAFAGKPRNKAAIEAIVRAISIPAQLGGGIRDLATIEAYLASKDQPSRDQIAKSLSDEEIMELAEYYKSLAANLLSSPDRMERYREGAMR